MDKWALATALHNAILEDKHHLQAADDGADDVAGSFDVSKHGIAYLVTDRTSKTTFDALKTEAFYLPLDFTSPPAQKTRKLAIPGLKTGTGSNMKISADASTVACLFMEAGELYANHLCLASVDAPEGVDALSHFGVDYSGYEPMGRLRVRRIV